MGPQHVRLDLGERLRLTVAGSVATWVRHRRGSSHRRELTLSQLFFSRPVPGWARYKTPLRSLWMCGSATHPGGGIMGAPGRIAALEVLKSVGRR